MDKATALTEAISLTDEILLLLDDQDFDGIGQLDARRLPLIEQAFSGSIEEIDQMRAWHLQSLNQQVVDRLNQFKDEVMQQQVQLRRSSTAAKAYQSNR